MLVPNLKESVLRILSRHERYGWEVMQGIRLVTGEEKAAAQGTIYPLLRKLEKQGMLEGRWASEEEERGGARRRYYKITEAGKKQLATLDKIHRDLAKFKLVIREINAVNKKLQQLCKKRNKKRVEKIPPTQASVTN